MPLNISVGVQFSSCPLKDIYMGYWTKPCHCVLFQQKVHSYFTTALQYLKSFRQQASLSFDEMPRIRIECRCFKQKVKDPDIQWVIWSVSWKLSRDLSLSRDLFPGTYFYDQFCFTVPPKCKIQPMTCNILCLC